MNADKDPRPSPARPEDALETQDQAAPGRGISGRRAPGPDPEGLTRRDFLRRTAVASGLALASGGLFAALHDAAGPPPLPPEKALEGLPDFSLPDFAGDKARLAVARGPDRVRSLQAALDALGGLGRFVAKNDSVLIKVNAAFASPPALGATTHPDLAAALVSLCLKAGASRVAVTDNPIHNPESCFDLSGLAQAVRQAGGTLVLPSENLFVPVTLKNARLIRDWPVMAGAFKGVDKVLAVAPVKDHHRAGASMILKNWYGLLGGRRSVFHQDINGIIAELALLIRPTLCVLDGTTAMVSNGPTGGSLSDLADTNTLIVSTDPVAADAAGVEVLGRTLAEVPYVQAAGAMGAGRADWRFLNPIQVDAGGQA